jgi:uncharacterized protein YuzE
MAKINTKMSYDEEEDILVLSKGKKVKASIDIGDFVIDVDLKGFITGLEILNASENLKISSTQLKELQEASMAVTYKPNYVYISLFMKFKGKEKEITIPLAVDLGHGSLKTENILFAVATV